MRQKKGPLMTGSTWHFMMKGKNNDTGEEITLVDDSFAYNLDWPEVLDETPGVALLNELIARLNERLHERARLVEEKEIALIPFLGTCRHCKQVVDAMHLYGPGSDICDRCSE